MLTVLGRNNSSNVQKVTWCLEELGVPYRREEVGGAFGRNRDARYLAMNPNGLIPTVVFDSHSTRPSSTTVGMRPFGFIARYPASLLRPKAPPTSSRR